MIRTTPWFLAAVVVLLTSQGPVNAQTEATKDVDTAGLVIESTAGWDGTIDRGGSVPIAMLLNNYGDEAIEGQVVLTNPYDKRELRIGDVFIGAGATRRFSTIQALNDWDGCFVSIQSDSKVLWRRELSLRTGQEFYPNVNFVLAIDDGGRSLAVGAFTDVSSITSEEKVAPENGRPIRSLTVKSWQMPDHFGPLTTVQAIVFPEEYDTDALNRAQWDSIAKWMCQGGAVFAHQESKELVARLLATSVLDGAKSSSSREFNVRPMGLGAIYEYADPLFASEGASVRKAMADVVARLDKHTIYRMADETDLNRHGRGQADWNRFMVVGFFLCYLLLSGVVCLLLFRLSRKMIRLYMVTVVGGACVAAGLLGVMLRLSEGDLRWTSVTQVGNGGAVQVAKIVVQSAGARNTQVAVTGDHVDMQSTGVLRYWYRRYSQRDCYSAFSLKPNLAKDVENAFRTDVAMTPWGERQLLATAFLPRFPTLDFELQFDPAVSSPQDKPSERAESGEVDKGAPKMPKGEFTVRLTNHLPHDLLDCWIVIGVTTSAKGSAALADEYSRWGNQSPEWAKYGGMVDVYQCENLRSISASKELEKSFGAHFSRTGNQWQRDWSWNEGSVSTPKISRLGTATAWIVGRLSASPSLAIDADGSDFVAQEELHVFVQEIQPEDMPALELFLDRDALPSASRKGPLDSDDASNDAP